MYFQKLESLSQLESFDTIYPIVDALDTWLAFLPQSYKDRIIPEQFTFKEKVPVKLVYKLFDELVELNMFKERYIVRCPEDDCNHVLYIANGLKDLKKYIEEFNNNCYECNFCEKTSKISSDYIFVIYELIDKPREDYVKKNIFNNFEMEYAEGKNLSALIKDNPDKYKEELGDIINDIAPDEVLDFILKD